MFVERLRAAPVTAPLVLAVAIFLAWVPLDGGQPLTRWAPGALAILALIAVAAVAQPQRWAAIPSPIRAALVLLGAFTLWSFCSIAWADDQGAALEGADRTLLYLAIFALFALWPQRPITASWILGAWTIGVGVLAAITLIRVGAVAHPRRLFLGERLMAPAGYANADAALWLLALWPAITLAATRRIPWALRGLLAGLAVVLCDVALLSQSRGAALSIPVCGLLMVAFVPGRLRNLAVLVPIALGAGAAGPAVLDVGDEVQRYDQFVRPGGPTDHVVIVVLIAAAVTALVVAAVAALETYRPPSRALARTLARAWTTVVVVVAVAGAGVGLVAAGGPVKPLRSAWHSFKGGYESNPSGNRLTSGLGSGRYDFYRVALNLFADHPVAGIGADNFFQDYLQHGTTDETPSYPHDLALRTLAQTGVIGGLLLLGALASALVAAWQGMRPPGGDALSAAVAGGAALVFLYWIVHGMTDWFWEWAGLGAPAFAFLGLACALTPRGTDNEPRPARRAGPAFLAAGLLVAALVIAAPWLAERQVRQAATTFATRPFEAYDRLDDAARLNPFSDRPALVKGSIALRYGDIPRAQAAFRDALKRNPRGQYATLELGAIASARGDRAGARALLDRAARMAPRDPIAREARSIADAGGTVDLVALNARILAAGEAFGAT